MPATRKVTEVTGVSPATKASRELHARLAALGTWDKVSFSLRNGAFTRGYLWQCAMGRKVPSKKLLLALGIVRPDKRTGVRVRMSVEEAELIIFALMSPDAPPVRMRLVRLAAKAGSQYAIDYMKSRGVK